MKDLDFDELDRAVSSLMTNTGESMPEKSTEKVLTITPTLGANDTPTFPPLGNNIRATTPQVAPSASSNSPTLTPSPAARRGGRFMDVVHPSSDMRSAAMPNRVSRVGTTVETPSSTVPEPTPAEPSVLTPVSATPTTPEVDRSPSEPEAPAWPDPIDFHAAEPTATTPDEPEPAMPEMAPEVPQEETEAETEPDTTNEAAGPLQSPFLADAKVEKRPLGAFAQTDTPSSDTVTPDTTSPEGEPAPVEDTPQPDTNASSEPVPAVLPEELKSDIVAIEADESVAVEPASASPEPSSQSIATAVNLGSTSIKQQYKEVPSTTPVDHAPIYDSPSYNQPLAHPAKKKSGWLVVFLIVLLILVGGGVGAAIYFYVL